jgi:beta-hydroxylase
MLEILLAPKFIVLYVFVVSAVYIHYRGHVRYRFLRQGTDHSTLVAPYNALTYLFSAVPNRPFIDVKKWLILGSLLYWIFAP